MARKRPDPADRIKKPQLLKIPTAVPDSVDIMQTIRVYGYDPRFLKSGSSALLFCKCTGGCGSSLIRSRSRAHDRVKCQSCINKGRGPWSPERMKAHSAMMRSWISEKGNPWKGAAPSAETRKKMSDSAKKRARPERKLKRPSEWRPHKGRGLRFKYEKNGLLFWVRSSWERAVIDYFNDREMDFEYEPRKFLVEYEEEGIVKKGTYTPDFYIPSLKVWWEIKGRWTKVALLKHEAFTRLYPEERIEVLHEKDLLDKGIHIQWSSEEKALLRAGVWPREAHK